jgi:UDP-glucose 4-epimerase
MASVRYICNMKIAVTGGAGFIGSNLVKKLVGLGHNVTVVDNLSTGLKSNLQGVDCDFHRLSIENFTKLRKIVRSCEAIFHFAARGSVPRSIINPLETYRVNLAGTLNILEISRENGAHIIYSSSSSVYGSNTLQPKIEETWTLPLSPYGASKLSAEAFLFAYASSYKIPITNFRFFNVYGPLQRPDHAYAAVIPKWIWLAMNGGEIEVYGDGSQTRDFTFIDNVTTVAVSSLSQISSNAEPINLAYGNSISLNHILAKLYEVFPSLRVKYLPSRTGDVMHSQNNPKKLFQYFPNSQPVDFDTGFYLTYEWLKSIAHQVK